MSRTVASKVTGWNVATIIDTVYVSAVMVVIQQNRRLDFVFTFSKRNIRSPFLKKENLNNMITVRKVLSEGLLYIVLSL
jgi:hypothetical protein